MEQLDFFRITLSITEYFACDYFGALWVISATFMLSQSPFLGGLQGV